MFHNNSNNNTTSNNEQMAGGMPGGMPGSIPQDDNNAQLNQQGHAGSDDQTNQNVVGGHNNGKFFFSRDMLPIVSDLENWF
jgi:hypothetical protein